MSAIQNQKVLWRKSSQCDTKMSKAVLFNLFRYSAPLTIYLNI